MSVMSKIFGSMNPFQEQPAASAVAGNAMTPGPQTPVSDGTTKGIPVVEPGKSPLDNFAHIHDAPKTGDAPRGIPKSVPDFTISPDQIRSTAKSVNFTEGVDPALYETVAKGGPEAVQAMQKIMQTVGENSMVSAFAASAKTTEMGLSRTADNFQAQTLPELQRRQRAAEGIRKEMPFFDHPTVAPMLKGLETSLLNANPGLPAETITEHAKTVMGGMFDEYARSQGKVLVDMPNEAGAGQRDAKGNEDWSKYFGELS